jgi:hypothetical protein
MNAAYNKIIAASDEDRRGLFVTAAARVGTTAQNIEKDFWVCWTLDALFHRLNKGGPRLLFKGGTSLSKGYSLISRFSEDIDVTVFRADLGKDVSVEEIERLGKRKRQERLDDIKAACQHYIGNTLRAQLTAIAVETMNAVRKDPARFQIALDDGDHDAQSLRIHYPSVLGASVGYVPPFVKIESGAKSALDPHQDKTITPYVASDVSNGGDLAVPGVTTIDPERTFLDKILILHGMTFYFEAAGALRGNGRMSRHYYDAHRLMATTVGEKACRDDSLITDCVRHAQMFFYRKNTGLEVAKQGSFRLVPSQPMIDALQRDYDAMSTMIFGEVPGFDAILESIGRAEALLNGR